MISIGEKVKRYQWCLNKGLNESGNKMDIPIVEILADTGLLTYFVDSNLAETSHLRVDNYELLCLEFDVVQVSGT